MQNSDIRLQETSAVGSGVIHHLSVLFSCLWFTGRIGHAVTLMHVNLLFFPAFTAVAPFLPLALSHYTTHSNKRTPLDANDVAAR